MASIPPRVDAKLIAETTPCPAAQDTPLSSLNASLIAHPPTLGTNQDDRYASLLALDCWAKRLDTVYWDCYRNESNAGLWRYSAPYKRG